MGKCLSRRPQAQRSANVREREAFLRRSPDGKLTRFGAETAILLQKWCTFAIKDW